MYVCLCVREIACIHRVDREDGRNMCCTYMDDIALLVVYTTCLYLGIVSNHIIYLFLYLLYILELGMCTSSSDGGTGLLIDGFKSKIMV